ncbi:hypothetical protein Tco_0373056, partial [Tanacetum coccineum]
RAPYTFTPSIEATIVELIVAPTRKITRFIEATTKAATLPPRKRFQMRLLLPVATAEAMAEAAAPCRRSGRQGGPTP